jgi:Calx-beta domain
MRIHAPRSLPRVMLLAVMLLAVIPAAANAAPKKVFLRFGSTSYSVAENEGTFNVTVIRSGNSSVTTTVKVNVDGSSTAVAGTDYTLAQTPPITLTFNPGQTTKTVPVSIIDNSTFNRPNKFVRFTLSNASSTPSRPTQFKNSQTTLTILDNDGPGTMDFSSASYNVVESAGVATVTVARNGNLLIPESVHYATSDGSATAGSDYTATSGTLTFGAGTGSASFQVPIADDQSFEGDEGLQVTLSQATNLNDPTNPNLQPNLGPNNPAAVTIVDDDVPTFSFSSLPYSANETDGAKTITVTRSGATYVDTTVDYATSDGTAQAGTDYVATSGSLHFAPGDTEETFQVPIINDGASEGNETLNLHLSRNGGPDLDTAVMSIVDNDNPLPSVQFSSATYNVNESDAHATVTVALSRSSDADVSVGYATADDSATNGATNPDGSGDYVDTHGTLTIPAHQTSATIDVPLNPDSVVEGDEDFTIALSPTPTNAVTGDPSTATVNIADDDTTGTLQFSALRYDVNESAGHATITVNRVGGSGGPATVDYATSDGTAAAPGDYGATSGTLSFANGETQKTFQIPVVWDGRQEGDETVSIELSNFDSDDDQSAVKAAVLHIADDGASGPVQFSAASYTVSETAGNATIIVNRSGGSLGGPVTVDYAGTDGTHGTLTFGSGDASETFQVPVVDDNVHTGTRTVNLTLSNPGGGTSLGSQATAALNITDDEPASSPSTDKSAPKLTITAKKLQKALTGKKVAFKVRSNEAASLQITLKFRKGKAAKRKVVVVKKASKKVAAGKTVKVTLKLDKKALRALTKALVKGKVKITLSVKGTDAAKNSATVNKTITLR